MSKTEIVIIVFMVVFMAFAIWAAVSGPCTLYKFAPIREVPARCLEGYTK